MRTIGGLAIVGLVITLVVCGAAGAAALTGPSALDYAREQAEIARIERQAALDAAWAPVRAAVVNLAMLGVTVGSLAYLAVLAGLHARRVAVERRPDPRGLLPVRAADQAAAVAALQAWHVAQLAAAQRAHVPHSYSPHIVFQNRQDGAALLPGGEAPALPAPAVPSFGALLDQGRVGRGRPLLLGFDGGTGAAVEGSWLDLYSCAVGGLSGSGKSWTACFLAAQAALYGSRIVLLDPHADNAESLAQRLAALAPCFVCDVASEPRAMLAAVNLVAEELERRKAGGRGAPWLFIADEFSALQRGALAEPLAALVEALGQEGRKLQLYGMVCGQVWSGTRSGGTELRDSLASAYVHRLRPAQARMLTGLTSADLPADLISLPAGAAYLLSTAGELRPVVIPQMRPADIQRVAALLVEGGASGGLPRKDHAPAREAHVEAQWKDHAPQQDDQARDAEEARILAALRSGKTPAEVASILAGTSSGRRYQDAARRVALAIQRALLA